MVKGIVNGSILRIVALRTHIISKPGLIPDVMAVRFSDYRFQKTMILYVKTRQINPYLYKMTTKDRGNLSG